MFDKFKGYMFYLLHKPLKAMEEKSEIYKLFSVIGNQFDTTKNLIIDVKNQSNINTATGKYLDLHASDRDMIRYINEPDEDFRRRISMKSEVSKMAGTLKGITLALKSLNYKITIEPCYIIYKTRWAEFYVIIEDTLGDTPYNFNIIKQTVMEAKQASAKPNYGFRYLIDNKSENKITTNLNIKTGINFWGNNYKKLWLDGNYLLNGYYELNGFNQHDTGNGTIKNVDIIVKVKEIITNNQSFSLEIKTDYFLDGKYFLSGKTKLMSGEEVIEL